MKPKDAYKFCLKCGGNLNPQRRKYFGLFEIRFEFFLF